MKSGKSKREQGTEPRRRDAEPNRNEEPESMRKQRREERESGARANMFSYLMLTLVMIALSNRQSLHMRRKNCEQED